MKKGMTRFHLSPEEEKEFLDYRPIKPEIIQWEELIRSSKFAVKSYKDSVYRGEIENSMR